MSCCFGSESAPTRPAHIYPPAPPLQPPCATVQRAHPLLARCHAHGASIAPSLFLCRTNSDIRHETCDECSAPFDARTLTAVTAPAPALPPNKQQQLPPGCRRFSYRELQDATGDFAANAVIGEGGFGKVFRGTLENGTAVAIKCLDRLGLQGDAEFEVEVQTLARLRHPNLVTLLGACTERRHRLAVFDLMPGGSLRDGLDHRTAGRPGQAPAARLLWPARVDVALGAARGLAFLHEGTRPGLIHRDVKSSNVLLDSRGRARIADFGLAVHTGNCSGPEAAAFEMQATSEAEILTGTFGYSAPEYTEGGRIGQKSDVYSFGVVLLELLTGQMPVDASRPVGSQMLVDEILPLLQEGDLPALQAKLDKDMPRSSVPVPQLAAFSEVAVVCLNTNPKRRPRMSEVVKFLEAIAAWRESLPDRSSGGRHTLLSLMDSMAEVPPIRSSDAMLTSLVGPSQLPAVRVEPQPSLPSPERREGTSSARFSTRSSGPESWPSMPLSPGPVAPRVTSLECETDALYATGPSEVRLSPRPDNSEATSPAPPGGGNPFASPGTFRAGARGSSAFLAAYSHAAAASEPPAQPSEAEWVSFGSPTHAYVSQGGGSRDPAHLWTSPLGSDAWKNREAGGVSA